MEQVDFPAPRRWPRPEFWAQRRRTGGAVRRLIETLDPAEDDAEIAHLSMEVLTPPILAHLAYAHGAARTVASPRIAERATRNGEGKQLVSPLARNLDTLTFFGELVRRGHRSAEGVAACARIQDIHRSVGRIRDDDQVFVLSQLILGPERIGRVLGFDPFSQRVRDALLHFWTGVGKAMRLREVPESRGELLSWVDAYERRWFEPTTMGHQAAEGYLRGLELSLPRPARRWARSAFIVLMDDAMLSCLGYEPLGACSAAALRTQWRAVLAANALRPVRLDATWVAAFSRTGPNPDLAHLGADVQARCPIHASK